MYIITFLIGLLMSAASSDVIPLVVKERAGVVRVSDPVTFGIPFPMAAKLYNTNTLGIYTSGGAAVPAQFRVTGRWGGPADDESLPVRWVLVDFMADVPAQGEALYELRTAGSTAATGGIVVNDAAGSVNIATGAATFSLSKTKFNLFDQVIVGNDTVVASGKSIGALVKSGTETFLATGSPVKISIEEQGALRTVVLVDGKHGSNSDFTARFVFYANKSYVKVFYRVENNRVALMNGGGQPDDIYNLGGKNSTNIDDLSLSIQLNTSTGLNAYMQGDQAPQSTTVDAGVKLYQESSGLENWNAHTSVTDGGNLVRTSKYVGFKGYRMTKGTANIESGNFAIGWLAAFNGSHGALVACRDFWQQYPKALRISPAGVLDLSLLPDEFPQTFNLRVGEYKTHETFFSFYSENKTAANLEADAKAFNEPLFALAPTIWYAKSRAIQDFPLYLRPANTHMDSAFELSIAATVDSTIGRSVASLAPSGNSIFESINRNGMYGWQDFGDIPQDFECGRGQYGLKYHGGYGFLLQFLRTRDYRFWELGENGERHEGDMDIIHTGRDTLACYGAKCFWDGAYFGHSNHNECGDRNPNRNTMGGNPDIAYAAPGLFLYHFLSGNPWALEYAKETSEKILRLQSFTQTNNRPTANTIRILYEAWRATGDTRFRDGVEKVIATSIEKSNYSGRAGFSDFEYLKSIGMYIDYKELITGKEQTLMRKNLLRGVDSLRNEVFYDSGEFAASYGHYDWNRNVADMYAYAFKFNQDSADFKLAGRLMNTGIAADGVAVGCDASVWGPAMIKAGDGCHVNHYYFTKEAVNAVTMGMVYMAQKHPVEPYNPSSQNNVLSHPATLANLLIKFNPSTSTIIFSLTGTENQSVTLKIFDMHGRRVADLSKSIQNGQVQWHNRKSAQNLYIAKAEIGNKTFSRKFAIAR